MTRAQAKKLYIGAGGPDDHSDAEWKEIHKEMASIVDAKSDGAAARLITWWNSWPNPHTRTATAFVRKVRKAWKEGTA